MIRFHLALIDEDAMAKLTFAELAEYRRRAAEYGQEGLRRAESLRKYGHTELRVIADSDWELAITCDACGLWAHMSRYVRWQKSSAKEEGGALLEVVSCDPAERHRRFGSYSGENAWNGHSTWNWDEPLVTNREGELMYPRYKKKGKSGWMKMHEAMKRIEMGGDDEATTEE